MLSDDKASAVHRLLVTTSADLKMDLWAVTGVFANWIEGRENGDRETWLVTVFGEDLSAFVEAAKAVGVTVQEIDGGGDTESYRTLAGEEGSGWVAPPKKKPQITVADRFGGHPR